MRPRENGIARRISPVLERRKPISIASRDLISTRALLPGKSIPLVIEPKASAIDFLDWVNGNLARVDQLLLQHRALLFRNFLTDAAESEHTRTFERFVAATSRGERLPYIDRTTPRTSLGTNLYTSTIHPADQTILLHNEGTLWLHWPMKILFMCVKAAATGGETPICDVRKVYRHIDPDIRETFRAKRMMLVRNFNDGYGLSWQDVFQTEEPRVVEQFCREQRIEFRWKPGGRLQTRQVRPAIRRHPSTGEPVWFNHVAFFHPRSLPEAVRDNLMAELGRGGLPYHSYYGDGSDIGDDVIDHINQAYRRQKVAFPWQEGDILFLDNMSIAHGRGPFTGDRKVIVCMTEACAPSECPVPAADPLTAAAGDQRS